MSAHWNLKPSGFLMRSCVCLLLPFPLSACRWLDEERTVSCSAVYSFFLTSHSHPSMLLSSLMRAGVILLLPFLVYNRCCATHFPSALC